jgi:hypothetical protein
MGRWFWGFEYVARACLEIGLPMAVVTVYLILHPGMVAKKLRRYFGYCCSFFLLECLGIVISLFCIKYLE